MLNPIKRIVQFNQDAGLLDKGYDDFLEASFQIEEALEGLAGTIFFAPKLGLEPEASCKDISRAIVADCIVDGQFISNVDRLDKACDAIVFAIGSMAKLGLDHHGITKALNLVNNANKAKLGMARDEHGKLLKPDNFTGPEAELAKLLSETRR